MMSQNQRESDDSVAATATDIKAIVAEIAEAEGGITTHQAGRDAFLTSSCASGLRRRLH